MDRFSQEDSRKGVGNMSKIKGNYTIGNKDDLTSAVHGLDIFTKNWCMNCAETNKTNDLVFRCKQCEFSTETGGCLVKTFVNNHEHNYSMDNFGSMGTL